MKHKIGPFPRFSLGLDHLYFPRFVYCYLELCHFPLLLARLAPGGFAAFNPERLRDLPVCGTEITSVEDGFCPGNENVHSRAPRWTVRVIRFKMFVAV